MLNPVRRQDFDDVGQYITPSVETDKSQEWVWTVGKTQDRKGTQKAKRLSQLAINGLVKIIQK